MPFPDFLSTATYSPLEIVKLIPTWAARSEHLGCSDERDATGGGHDMAQKGEIKKTDPRVKKEAGLRFRQL